MTGIISIEKQVQKLSTELVDIEIQLRQGRITKEQRDQKFSATQDKWGELKLLPEYSVWEKGYQIAIEREIKTLSGNS